jgi:bifunctional non-homologous end joining protein LigD
MLVRDRLAELDLATAPVTSGSKGLHLYAALDGRRNAEEVRDLAKDIAQELTAGHKDLVLWQMTKARRAGKVFLDWSQNTRTKTTISPYSLRGAQTPFVAAPRTWAEIEQATTHPGTLTQLTLEEVLERVDRDGDVFGDQLHR